jgi:hypothetical protein
MKQTSSLTRNLAAKQELARARSNDFGALRSAPVSRVYRLYIGEITEVHDSRQLRVLITRYFSGATVLHGSGVWQGQAEPATVVEIIGTSNDVQRVADLAGDIRETWKQESVLVTWSDVQVLDIRAGAELEHVEPFRTFDDVGKLAR